jgi:hypothetical protein
MARFAPRSPLFRAKAPLDGLDVVEPGLGLDDGVEIGPVDHPVGTPQIAGQRDGYLRTPPKQSTESCGEASQKRDMCLVADRSSDGVDAETQLAAEDRGHLGEGLDARVRCEGSLDAEHLGVRDPDGPSQCPGAHADRHTRDTQLLAGASEQISTTAGA